MSEREFQNEVITPDTQLSMDSDMIFFIKSAIDEGDYPHIISLTKNFHPSEIVEVINLLDKGDRKKFINAISDVFEPEVLIGLEGEIKDQIMHLLSTKQSANAISQLELDDAVHVIEDLETEEIKDILDEVEDKKRSEIEGNLSYPEDSAGRLMNSRFIAVEEGWTVGKTIDFLREDNNLPDDFYEIFVVDENNKPVGGVLTSRIIRNERDIKISELISENLKTINVLTDQEEVAYIFQKFSLVSTPVVDDGGAIIGVLTIDDVVDIIEEEVEEDIMRLAGVSEIDIYSSSAHTALNRTPWLLINLFTAIAASAVIAMFQTEIKDLVALAVIMPIVASMAGNAGTQTLTVAVRSIATKELTEANSGRVLRKEIIASLFNGTIFAVIMMAVSYVLYDNTYLSIVLGVATIASLLLASIFGVLIPLVLSKIGVDPAISSSVFLTTITDMSSFFFFLGLSSWWLF